MEGFFSERQTSYCIISIYAGLGGVNIIEKLENASKEGDQYQSGKLLLDFNGTMGDRIQVFVE